MSSTSVSRAGARDEAEREDELEIRRHAVARALGIGVPVWLTFFVLDVFVVELLGADAPLWWFAAWRAAIAVLMAVGNAIVRRTRSLAGTLAGELLAFGAASFGVALLSTRYGGLDSYYIQGMSIVILFHGAAIPDRFGRGIVIALGLGLIYPALMAIAAVWSPAVAADWRDLHAVWLFVQNFMFVLATVIMAQIGSHFVWAARKQVYEARKLGRYRLKARIGVGGSGEVWLADDEKADREIALKILDREAAQRPGARARFEREARAAMSLHDPHTIRVFDWGASDDGVCFIAMELLDGADLGTLVRNAGPLPPERAVHFARQACASLAEAHAAGILHRDVKPENLFACRVGDDVDVLKLLDFGLAKVVRPEEDATLTQGAFVGGTPLYMPPEACLGLPVDARSDIYSLGAALYFLVTGRAPFDGETATVMAKHIDAAPEPPSHLAPLPPELDAVILKCLAKRPADRFASAHELDAALASCARAWTQERARAHWSSRGLPTA